MLIFLFYLGDLVPYLTVFIELLTLFHPIVVFKLHDFFKSFFCLNLEELFFFHFFPKQVLSAQHLLQMFGIRMGVFIDSSTGFVVSDALLKLYVFLI
jgi:hypothetical protein